MQEKRARCPVEIIRTGNTVEGSKSSEERCFIQNPQPLFISTRQAINGARVNVTCCLAQAQATPKTPALTPEVSPPA